VTEKIVFHQLVIRIKLDIRRFAAPGKAEEKDQEEE
jgi:hypothetical protein